VRAGKRTASATAVRRAPAPDTVAFADRITHIWTNTSNYLVTIRLAGPADAPGFDAARTALMHDFAVVIP
jgi:hypothetical protein